MPPKVIKCENGLDCPFLERPGGCMYHHPAEHIPCKNGDACPFLKVGGCRFKHVPSPGGAPVCPRGCGDLTYGPYEKYIHPDDYYTTLCWGWSCKPCTVGQ